MIVKRHQQEELHRSDQLQCLTNLTVINIKQTIQTQGKQLSPWKKDLFSDFSENCLQFTLFGLFYIENYRLPEIELNSLQYTRISNV